MTKKMATEKLVKEHNCVIKPEFALTVDDVILAADSDKLAVLLIKRKSFPYIDDWALPGGFVDKGETCEMAAARELAEEAGVEGVDLEQLYTVSTPDRDPRCRTVSTCFIGLLPNTIPLKANDDAKDASWFFVDYAAQGDTYELVLTNLEETTSAVMKIVRCKSGRIDINKSEIVSQKGIAFDHAKLILYAIETLS